MLRHDSGAAAPNTEREPAFRADMWPHDCLPGHHGIEAGGIRITRSHYAIDRKAEALPYQMAIPVARPAQDRSVADEEQVHNRGRKK